jgi:L-ascorbate metabolism protein UlaG (beta-lactamase superfamily)
MGKMYVIRSGGIAMEIQLIRHATVVINIAGRKILLDPMLSGAGTMSAVPGVANTSDNPLVDLPVDSGSLINAEAVIVTHTHRDHFDDTAMQILPHDMQLFCQPVDEEKIRAAGFTNVQSIEKTGEWNGITINRTSGRHGTGEMGEKMGPVSGFVLQTENEPTLYIAVDTIWCAEVKDALETYNPQLVLCFAGAARFSSGDPITMTKEDIVQVCQHAPTAKVIVVHMEAWNHCTLSRQELKQYSAGKNLDRQVCVPDDGEWVRMPATPSL